MLILLLSNLTLIFPLNPHINEPQLDDGINNKVEKMMLNYFHKFSLSNIQILIGQKRGIQVLKKPGAN